MFCFDGDNAGREAAKKVFVNVPLIHGQAYAVVLPDGMDPCDYRLKFGADALVEYLEKNEKPLIEFVLDELAKPFDFNVELEKAQYIGEAARVLRTVQDSVLRETYTRKVSLDTFASIKVINDAISKSKPLSGHSLQPKDNEVGLGLKVEETTDVDENLESIFANNEYSQLTYRMMTLVLMEPKLSDKLVKYADLLPLRLRELLKEVDELVDEDGARIVLERFTDDELVARLINNKTFPFSHITNSEELFDYLLERFLKYLQSSRVNKIRTEILQTLSDSNSQGSEFLKIALERELNALASLGISDSQKETT